LQTQGKVAEAKQALDMAKFSLTKMAAGGMYDHIGGGFHRYRYVPGPAWLSLARFDAFTCFGFPLAAFTL
jgi:uncharacterized protein YyaL (SSP411 family)